MRIELIAECASNAGGDMALAKEFIKRFADAGADWIKWQATRVKHLNPADAQYEWFKQAEWSTDQLAELKAETEAVGKKFLVTVYHVDDIAEIVRLGCLTIKIGSGEREARDIIERTAAAGLAVIRSFHWRNFNEPYHPNVRALATSTRYPASHASCLEAIDLMRRANWSGYSDHSIGTEMATWAMECGARIIEKHVQLDHQARPPRPFEATVSEFKYLRTFADDDPEIKYRGRWQWA